MEKIFQIESAILNRKADVLRSPYSLTILRQGKHSVSVDKVPVIEYFAFFDSRIKADQVKIKVYKTVSDDRWYDSSYSEEAEVNSPEFGIPGITEEVKSLIEKFEAKHKMAELVNG